MIQRNRDRVVVPALASVEQAIAALAVAARKEHGEPACDGVFDARKHVRDAAKPVQRANPHDGEDSFAVVAVLEQCLDELFSDGLRKAVCAASAKLLWLLEVAVAVALPGEPCRKCARDV